MSLESRWTREEMITYREALLAELRNSGETATTAGFKARLAADGEQIEP